jgi:hypothetical protein
MSSTLPLLLSMRGWFRGLKLAQPTEIADIDRIARSNKFFMGFS